VLTPPRPAIFHYPSQLLDLVIELRDRSRWKEAMRDRDPFEDRLLFSGGDQRVEGLVRLTNYPDQLAGFGILAVDYIDAECKSARHRQRIVLTADCSDELDAAIELEPVTNLPVKGWGLRSWIKPNALSHYEGALGRKPTQEFLLKISWKHWEVPSGLARQPPR
jgi:hypothetical protein